MATYKITRSSFRIAGVKYRRGDIVELENAEQYGTNIEPFTAPVEKKRRTRKAAVQEEQLNLESEE